jgi:hypothetical protein
MTGAVTVDTALKPLVKVITAAGLAVMLETVG